MKRIVIILLMVAASLCTAEAQRHKRSQKENSEIEYLGQVRDTYSQISRRTIDGKLYYVYTSQSSEEYNEPFKLIFPTAKEAIKSLAHLKIFAEQKPNNTTITFANDGKMITATKGKFIGGPYVEFTHPEMKGTASMSVKELDKAITILSKYIEE